jgi:hypothetical protein
MGSCQHCGMIYWLHLHTKQLINCGWRVSALAELLNYTHAHISLPILSIQFMPVWNERLKNSLIWPESINKNLAVVNVQKSTIIFIYHRRELSDHYNNLKRQCCITFHLDLMFLSSAMWPSQYITHILKSVKLIFSTVMSVRGVWNPR